MSRTKISPKQIQDAIDIITSRNEVPLVNSICKQLNIENNNPIVSQYLRKWKMKQSASSISLPESSQTVAPDQLMIRTQELENSLSLVRATLESTMDGILIVSRDNQIIDCNQKFISMWKIPLELIQSGDEKRVLEFALEQVVDPDSLYKLATKLYPNPEEKGELGEIIFKDGRVFERYFQPHRVGNQIVGRVWSFRDITERKRTEESLRLRDQAIESSPHGIIITDMTLPDQPIVYVNPAFMRITGYSKEEVIGRNCRFLQGLDNEQIVLRRIRLALQENTEENIIIRNYRKDGTVFWNQLHIAPVFNPTGKVRHFLGIMMDITNQKTLEEQLIHQATHDALTLLPNRSLLLDRIQQAIIQVRSTNLIVGVLFLDLDRFKLINDSLGHVIGDELLKSVADKLLRSVTEDCTVARIGGDEFVIVMPFLETEETAFKKAKQILAELAKPIIIEGNTLNITTSIGVSFYPKDADDASTLLRSSDMSMYLAKEQGRNTFESYTAELTRKTTRRMALENHLRSALERNEFILHYQPLINLSTGAIFGFEALLRWYHPELGIIAPQDFIPITEEDGLIIPIGKWVFQTACKQLKKLHQQGFDDLCISINLSSRQLHQPDVIEFVNTALKMCQIAPECVELEITETTLLKNTEETIDKLHRLREIGVRLSIDDFGTGYSSLNYLKQFPVHKLKIDRSFIQDLTTNENNAAITVAIIQLAKSLRLKVIAEGVETVEQMKFLREHNCDEGQGYYFGYPLEADSLLEKLKENASLSTH